MVRTFRAHHVLVPLLALIAVLPTIVHGCSCGHDMAFHVQSWLEYAQQLRHGTVYPHWAFSPAWQAGEPRFLFYPPLSWMLGAALLLVSPANWTPVLFTWVALTCAGFSMHRLAREFASREAALLSAAVYLANPYMLFNAWERAAFAELLAAIWIPLLLLAVLRARPTVAGVAVPLALVWLTNAPAGVMATYTVALLGLLQLGWMPFVDPHADASEFRRRLARLAVTLAGGLVLGLGMAGFYLLPAAYERRFVQVDMAIIPNLRYQDNFLFSRTAYEPHNEVTRRVSILALAVLLLTVVLVTMCVVRSYKTRKNTGSQGLSLRVAASLALLTAVIAFLLFPVSSPIWQHLPNLKFMQFPWRLMTILSAVLALSLTPLLAPLSATLARRRSVGWIAAAAIVLGLSQWSSPVYRQRCEATDLPGFAQESFRNGHGVLATDEYTPLNADNDVDRTDNPGYWLLAGDVNAYAPGTVQNPNEIYTDYDGPIPYDQTVASQAPMHLAVDLPRPETLVLNLRDYPNWRVTRNGAEEPPHLHRDDGLMTISLPAGASTIDVRWRRGLDQDAGDALSGCALAALGLVWWRSRKIKAAP